MNKSVYSFWYWYIKPCGSLVTKSEINHLFETWNSLDIHRYKGRVWGGRGERCVNHSRLSDKSSVQELHRKHDSSTPDKHRGPIRCVYDMMLYRWFGNLNWEINLPHVSSDMSGLLCCWYKLRTILMDQLLFSIQPLRYLNIFKKNGTNYSVI